jgi:hypothetical protein
MANLVSPGVSVTVTDESFYVPASAPTVPLIFIATADEKLQPNGITPAAGTFESNVVRTITSLQQSTQMYGIPVFKEDYTGKPLHGDARNEQGLLTLNKFLGLGSSAFVVRANVNLNDDTEDVAGKWADKMQTASFVLQNYITSFLDEYNTLNGYTPFSSSYKTTVTQSELVYLTNKATAELFALYTFKNAKADFFDNNLGNEVSTAGSQAVSFGGSITDGTAATGLAAQVYTATVRVDGVNKAISISGSVATTYNALITEINNDLGLSATAVLADGNIKITSETVGSASKVLITDTDLFASVEGFVSLYLPTDGSLADAPLPVFGNGFSQPPTGSYLGFEGMAMEWVDTHPTDSGVSEFTAEDAAELLLDAADEYSLTVEFLNKTSLGANDAARRVSIVTALAALINSNTDVRSERFEYNLIMCPGFPEVVDEMVALAQEIGEEAFVVADMPMLLSPEAAATWGTSSDRVRGTNVAYYYPGALTSNLDGKDVYSSSVAVALRTITNSDNVSKIHFAPAGPRRGLVTGFSKMGYLTGTPGTPTTFIETNLNVGQRNNLYQYTNNINPITEIPGRGIMVMGQKTSAVAASAMDRINVVRMLADLRRSLRKTAFSYLFEPNDQITRDNLKSAVDGVLSNLMVERGLYDYVTVCDASNNDGVRIDRNELYIDIALKPVRAVEFIYVPIRVLSTGATLAN